MELFPVHPRSIRFKNRAAIGSFINGKAVNVPVKFKTLRLTTISETPSAVEACGVQVDARVPFHPDNVSDGGDDRPCGPVKLI